jgi:hypothetical protein
MIIFLVGVMFSRYENEMSFTPIVTEEFVPNPSYFGRVGMDASSPLEDPRVVIGPLRDISTDSLLATTHLIEMSPEHSVPTFAESTPEAKVESLVRIPSPARTRVVLEWIGEIPSPLFRGEGDVNFVCGCCGKVVAEHVWRFSIIDIVLKCPHCGGYNESPTLEPPPSFVSVVAIRAGRYPLRGTIVPKRAVCLVGLRY